MNVFRGQRLAAGAVMALALAMAGCSGGSIREGTPPSAEGNTLAATTTVLPTSANSYLSTHAQTEGAVTDIQTDDGTLRSVSVTAGGLTHVFAESCWGDESFGECYDADGGRARVSNYFGTYQHLLTVEWERHLNVEGHSVDFYGEGIIGTRTAPDDMPKDIRATYEGQVIMRAAPDSGLASGDIVRQGMGDARFEADFGTGRLSGAFENFSDRETGDPLAGRVTMDGRIRDNGFSVDSVTGTFADMNIRSGSGQGHFFGPGAAELGGTATFTGSCNGGQSCSGTALFVGRKQ